MEDNINLNNPLPLYLQVEHAIRGQIERGELQTGQQLGSQQELSRKYNVSLITIKKAVTDLCKEGILMSRVGKGTFVAEKAQAKRILSGQKTIGLVLRDLKHQYFSLIVHSIEERAYQLGFNVLLSNSSGSIEKEEKQIRHFQELGVDGLIIASLSLEYKATKYIQKLQKENFPYVMVSYLHDPEYWWVGANQELGGYMATEHLINVGYKSIGYVHVGKGNLLSEVRKNGYVLALQEHDRPFDSRFIYYLTHESVDLGRDRFQLGYDFGREFRNLAPRPDALFVYSDTMALGLEQALIEQGVSIPDDVAIVGFDDVTLAEYASVPLTTIHQPADRIGSMAVEIIQKRIDGSDVSNRTIFKPSLIVRESCGAKIRGMVPPSTVDAGHVLG